MFDFHIHIDPTGLHGLLPTEALALTGQLGFKTVGLIARLDFLGLPLVFPKLNQTCNECSLYTNVEAYAGVELVDIPPAMYGHAVDLARELGAKLILGHGEGALSGYQGTNLAAILAKVDILAHPGMITPIDAQLAAEKQVALELNMSQSYSLCNGHIAKLAQEFQAPVLIGSNAKVRSDLRFNQAIYWQWAGLGALMDMQIVYNSAQNLIKKMRDKT